MRTVTVRSPDGKALAVAVLQNRPEGLRLTLDRIVSGKGRLLHHYFYFGKGILRVFVDSGDFRFSGELSTRWVGGERRWFARLHPVEKAFESSVEGSAHRNRRRPGAERAHPRRLDRPQG